MVIKNSFNFISEFSSYLFNQIRKIYLNSSFYNKKISKIEQATFEYKPSQSLLGCLINYNKKKEKIEDFYINSIWNNKNLNKKDYIKLHNFFWLFTVDLKSSKKIIQSIILNWIDSNENYNLKNWEIDILSKRIIAWISNSKLTYEESSKEYKLKFNFLVKKQINHLINEINRSDSIDDKMIGCSAIILAGLSYNDPKFLNYGLILLKKIIKYSLDSEFFPKSRNIRQLIFYLKYLILIREFLIESQSELPDYLDETIFHLGQAYNFLWQTSEKISLFNGNYDAEYYELDNYLKSHGYKFKNNAQEIGGYVILKNKNINISMDMGLPPEKKFSNSYQSGVLSFEILYNGKKLISNSGYFQDTKHQLNKISKSSAAHSTLILDNTSVCSFKKDSKGNNLIENTFKLLNKKIVKENNNWILRAAHDGYQKKYGVIHEREIVFVPEINKFIGKDKLIKKRNFKSSNFEIRFHLSPGVKVTKTQDGISALIELDNSGWRFFCKDCAIDIETGLFFGKKNSYLENQNIFVTGVTTNEDQVINWEILKI